MGDEIAKRFWAKVRKKRNSCWLWIGPCNEDGYGVGPKKILSHRFAYALQKGPIPKGKLIRHKCHTRRCVRPDHLIAGSNYKNALDTYRSGRLMHPVQRKIVEIGLRAERKYGKSPLAAKRARANYKAWERRAGHQAADKLNRSILRDVERIDGVLQLTGKDGKQITIPLGGRNLFYEDISGANDRPTRMKPRARFSPRQYLTRQKLLKDREDFISKIAAQVLGD